ncbi:hypothetical protein BKI52_41160 [marine bacterium AO1-C]|nr:hypothetical protein BKI52_41160 [marine bacterium AO1-C]
MAMNRKKIIIFGCLILSLIGCLQVQEISFIELKSSFLIPQNIIQVGDTLKLQQNSTTVAKKYLWEFGDGKSSDLPLPTHIYDSIGTYTVTLTVTKADGITQDTSTQRVSVLPATVAPAATNFTTFGQSTDDEVGLNFTPTLDGQATILMAKKNINILQLKKIDGNGTEVWTRDISNLSDGQVFGQKISPTNDGGFVVVGFIEDKPNENDAFILKVDKDGILQWQNVVSTELNEIFNDVQDINGSLVVVGSSQAVGGQSSIQFEVYDTRDGVLLNKQEVSSSNWTVSGLQLTQDGGFVVVGFEDNAPLIVKFDPSFKIQWNTTLSITGKARSVIQAQNRDFVFVGETTNSTGDSTNAFVARVNEVGSLVWLQTLQLSTESFTDVNFDQNQNIVVLGTHENILTSKDMIVAKYTGQGTLETVKLIGGKEEDEGQKLAYNPISKQFILIGSTESFGTQNARKDIFIVFVDENLN